VIAALTTARRCVEAGPSAALRHLSFDETRRAPRLRELPELPTRLAWFFVVLTRALFGHRECLFESVVLAAAFRRMGYDARVVIGHDLAPSFTSDFMHAWVEVDGEAVTLSDRGNGLQFTRVMAVPRD
jgi:transglutaminase superfamily protein